MKGAVKSKNKELMLVPESFYKTLFTTVTERKGQERFSCLQKEYFFPRLLHTDTLTIYQRASQIKLNYMTENTPTKRL